MLNAARDLPVANDRVGTGPFPNAETLVDALARHEAVHPNGASAIVIPPVAIRAPAGPEAAGFHVAPIHLKHTV